MGSKNPVEKIVEKIQEKLAEREDKKNQEDEAYWRRVSRRDLGSHS